MYFKKSKILKLFLVSLLVFTTTSNNNYAFADEDKVNPPRPPAPPAGPTPPVSPGILRPPPNNRTAADATGARPPIGSGLQVTVPETTAVGSVSVGCPFQTPSTGVMELVNRVQGALRAIDQEQNSCNQAVRGLIEEAQRQIDSLNTLQLNEVFPNNPGEVNCANYEAVYRRQFDLAIASNSGTIDSTLDSTSPYANCSSSENFNSCAEQVYVRQLSTREASCSNTTSGQNNQAIRQSLTSLTSTIDSIIQTAGEGGCNANATQSIVQTAISQATTAASMSAGFGLVGMGIGLAGRLLSSLANRIFNNNSAERYLRLIAEDVNNPARFCLFYDVQKAALGCEREVYRNAVMVGGAQISSNLCTESRDALTELVGLSSSLENETQRQTLLSRFNQPVGSTGKSYIDLIRDAHQHLRRSAASDPSNNNGARVLALSRVLNTYDQLMSNRGNDTEEAIARSTQLRTELITALGDQNLQLPEILNAYLESARPGETGTPAGAITASANVIEMIRRTNQNISDAQRYVTNSQTGSMDSAVLDRLLSAVNSTIGPSLERELENIFNQYRQNAGAQADATQEMQWLGRMLNICMSTQGAAYFNRGNTSVARLDLRTNPSETYTNICGAFNCGNDSMFVPFDPNGVSQGLSTEDRFKRYQCASDRRSAQAQQNLRNRLRQIASSNSQLSTDVIDANATSLQGSLRGGGGYAALRRRVCGSN